MTKILIAAFVIIGAGIILAPMAADFAAETAFKEGNIDKSWAPKAAYHAGNFHLTINNVEKARSILKKALQTWDDFEKQAECVYKIAESYVRTEPEKALKWYQRYVDNYPAHKWHSQAERNIAQLKAQPDVTGGKIKESGSTSTRPQQP